MSRPITPTRIKRAETIVHSITFKDPDGVVRDLTGATLKSSLVEELEDAEVAALTATLSSPSEGLVQIEIPVAVSTDLTPDKTYYYDVIASISGQNHFSDTYAVKVEGRATEPD